MLNKTIVLSSFTSAGKDTAITYINKKYNIPISISYTTRPKRPSEVEGREYIFVSYDEFSKLDFPIPPRVYNTINNGEPDTWYYGTNPNVKNKLVILDRGGAEQLIKSLGRDNVTTIYIETKDDILLERLNKRGDEEGESIRRLSDDKVKFEGFTPDYKIQNNSSLQSFYNKIDMVMEDILKGGIDEVI